MTDRAHAPRSSLVAAAACAALLGVAPPMAIAESVEDPAADAAAVVPELDEVLALQELEQASRGGASSLEEELLVLSASRVPFRLDEAPAILSVITAEDLAAMGARTIADALRMVPELDVTRDVLGHYHAAIRGRRADPEVLVLLDGQRLNDFYDGVILYDLPIAMIDRIEVIRGPGSAVYGTNAVAGVIAIYSRAAEELAARTYVAVSTTGGERDRAGFGNLHLSTHAARPLGRRLGFSGSAEVTLGPGAALLVETDSLTGDRFDPETLESQSLACDLGELCPASAYTRPGGMTSHVTLGLHGRPGGLLVRDDAFHLVFHGITQERGPFIGEFDVLTPDSRLSTVRTSAIMTYEVPVRGDAVRFSSTSGLDVSRIDRLLQNVPDGYRAQVGTEIVTFPEGQLKDIELRELTVREDARLQVRLHPMNTTLAGVELEYAALRSYRIHTNYDESGRPYDDLGPYLTTSFPQSGRDRTVVGAYVENVTSLPFNIRMILGGRYDWYSDFGDAISPRGGLVLRLGPVVLKSFFGMAFRAPTFQELYDTSSLAAYGGYIGNPDLGASRVATLDGGALYSLSAGGVELTYALNGYYSQIWESIDRAPLTGLRNQYQNSSDVESFGFAVEARARIRRRHTLFGNASWFRARSDYAYVTPDFDYVTETDLRSVPAVRANLGGRVALWRWLGAGAWFMYRGERRNDERTPLERLYAYRFPATLTVNLGVDAERFWRGLSARLFVDNALDTASADAVPKPSEMPEGAPRDRVRAMLVLDWSLEAGGR